MMISLSDKRNNNHSMQWSQFADETKRLQTFKHWPLQKPTPEECSKAGLFYSGLLDIVVCIYCDGQIGEWKEDDDPWIEHAKHFPHCYSLLEEDVKCKTKSPKNEDYLKGLNNIKISSNDTKACHSANSEKSDDLCNELGMSDKQNNNFSHARFADDTKRLQTFKDWPLHKPTPQELSEQGLYYTGEGDIVVCIYCGGTLGNWEKDDDPCIEHARHFPHCHSLLKEDGKTPKNEDYLKGLNNIKISSNNTKACHSANSEESDDLYNETLIYLTMRDDIRRFQSFKNLSDPSIEYAKSDSHCISSLEEDRKCKTESNNVKISSNNTKGLEILQCKVCFNSQIQCTLQPCGHFVMCDDCFKSVKNCPICRKPIHCTIKTYMC